MVKYVLHLRRLIKKKDTKTVLIVPCIKISSM